MCLRQTLVVAPSSSLPLVLWRHAALPCERYVSSPMPVGLQWFPAANAPGNPVVCFCAQRGCRVQANALKSFRAGGRRVFTPLPRRFAQSSLSWRLFQHQFSFPVISVVSAGHITLVQLDAPDAAGYPQALGSALFRSTPPGIAFAAFVMGQCALPSRQTSRQQYRLYRSRVSRSSVAASSAPAFVRLGIHNHMVRCFVMVSSRPVSSVLCNKETHFRPVARAGYIPDRRRIMGGLLKSQHKSPLTSTSTGPCAIGVVMPSSPFRRKAGYAPGQSSKSACRCRHRRYCPLPNGQLVHPPAMP